MQKICSKCGSETSDDGDLHCRKILQTETRRLLLCGKTNEAVLFLNQAPFGWEWKERMLKLLFLEPEIQQKKQQEREKEQFVMSKVQNQFAPLAEKYGADINKVMNKSGPTPLTSILIKLDKAEILDESELEWLKNLRKNWAYVLLANYYYQPIKRFSDVPTDATWNLSMACGFFRDASLSQKAIEITDGFSERIVTDQDILIKDSKASSAVYTSRGGALRDLRRFDEAKKCANKAISLSESFYPYNLLGGISYDEGNPEEGDKYFAKASELGSPPRMQEAEIWSALQHTEAEAKSRIIAYLLQKDPQKYAWVKQFQTK